LVIGYKTIKNPKKKDSFIVKVLVNHNKAKEIKASIIKKIHASTLLILPTAKGLPAVLETSLSNF